MGIELKIAAIFIIAALTLFVEMLGPRGELPCYPSLDEHLEATWVWCEPSESSSDKEFGEVNTDQNDHIDVLTTEPFPSVTGDTPNEENSQETSGE